MKALNNFSVGQKLTVIALVSTAVALLLTALGFVTHEALLYRRNMIHEQTAVAQMLGENTAAALMFSDPDSASQTLKSVNVYAHVMSAVLYDREGRPFAHYRSPALPVDRVPPVPAAEADGHRWSADAFELFRRIHVAGEHVGTVYLRSNLNEMRTSIVTFLSICGAVLLVAGFAAYFMSRRLQPLVTGPVSHLAMVARAVAADRDYTVRAIKQGDDELGALVETFNTMLDQLQSRELALRDAHDQLEVRVEERTRELQQEITVRRRSEEALRESHERFQTVTRTTTDVVWDWDLATNALWWNENYQSLFGYDPAVVPPSIESWTMNIHPDDVARVTASVHAAQGGSAALWSAEYRFRRNDGSYAVVFDRGYILRSPEGKAIRMIGALQDISARKRAEEEVAIEKSRLQLIFESVPVGISLDHQPATGERLRLINDAHLRICGLQRGEESLGIFTRITHPEDAPRQQALRTRLESGEVDRFSLEKRYIRPDGKIVWVNFSLQRQYYPDGGWLDLSTVADITNVKEAHEQNAREQARFKFIFDAVPVGISLISLGEAGPQLVNPAHERITGISRADSSRPGIFAAITHPDDRARQEPFVQQFARGEIDGFNLEKRYIHPDGRVAWVSMSSRMFTEPNTGARQSVTTLVDITERKHAEAKLAETHKQLLDTSRQAGMAEVATGVLHNVGNVLNSVNVSTTLLADLVRQSKADRVGKIAGLLREQEKDLGGFFSRDPRGRQVPVFLESLATHLAREQTEITKELDSLRKNVEHIKDIVAMQQNYAKVSGVVETIGVVDLIDDALRMHEGGLARHEIVLECDYQARPLVTVEKHKVLQILVNLLRNAKYACDESGRGDKRMIIRVSTGNEAVQIAVVDNGVGIPAENLTRIFAHGFTTRKHGHGFGLHSGALAARELGGSLTAHSDGPGCGATFILELPFPSAESAA